MEIELRSTWVVSFSRRD